MAFFDFIKRKQSLFSSGVLAGMEDRHSHILFGVDDGVSRLEESLEVLSFDEAIRKLKGDDLPVSAFMDKVSGIFNGGNTKYEKRDIAERVPCFNPINCIQCNQCAFVCPHAVIRPFLLDKNDNKVESVDSIFPRDYKYSIGVSYKDCTYHHK